MTSQAEDAVRLTRKFNASPQRLFDAWLDPDLAGKWLFTSASSESHSTLIDARPGGAWAITDRREGVDYTAVGQYLEIDPPRRLVFSFGMRQFSPILTSVIVEIAPDGEGSVLTLTQDGVGAGAESATKDGWLKMFEALEALLARGEG
ncbi:MAG TPA: SRPBCC family protein [Caulobacteraceae bacterium]